MIFIHSLQATANQSNESKEEEELLVERKNYSVLPNKIKSMNTKMTSRRSGIKNYTIEAFQEACDHFKKDFRRIGFYPTAKHHIYKQIAKRINEIPGNFAKPFAIYSRFNKKRWETEKYFVKYV